MNPYQPKHGAGHPKHAAAPPSRAWADLPARRWVGITVFMLVLLGGVVAIGLTLADDSGDDSGRPDQSSTPTEGSTPDPDRRLLSWAPPDMSDATTVLVGDDWVYELNPGRDYRVEFPARPVDHPVVLSGGRNVVVIGGEINIPDQGPDPSINQRRGLFLRKQTGVVHIEGLLITGEDLSEGIQIDAPDAVVQIQNVRVEHIRARDQVEFTDNHPDIVQPWGGVGELRVDGLTGQTDYQGLFLQSDYEPIGSVVLRRVNIDADPTARYLLWTSGDFELTLDRVFVSPAPGRSFERTLWPDVGAWVGVVEGSPPGGDFVGADVVGFAYEGGWSYADDQT